MPPFRPIFEATTIKPPTQAQAARTLVLLGLIRNNFKISTWLAMGALLQALLVLLPVAKVISILPVATFLAWRIGDHALISYGWKLDPYIQGVINGKTTSLFPGAKGEAGKPGEGDICVVILTSRSNAPAGVFHKHFQTLGKYQDTMNDNLDATAPTNGLLGNTRWLSITDRATTSELMAIYYFRSRAQMHAWAHTPAHREGWDWWNGLVAKGEVKNIGIAHEIYDVPAGRWENIAANMAPYGFGTTAHAFVDAEGVAKWASPLLDASRGGLKSARGRMAMSDGDDNDGYGLVTY